MTSIATTQFPEITSTRIFDAPPALVWQAWTDPVQVIRWWGPEGFSTTVHKMDFREGGEWLFTMHGPDGRDYENHNVFNEISPVRRLVFRHVGPPRHSMTINFEPHGDGTKITMLHVFDDRNGYDLAVIGHKAVEGAIQHLDRLNMFLAAGSR